MNPDQQAYNVIEDLDSWISDQDEWQQEHLAAWIFGVFASLALVLAAVGLYSVVTYTVAQRRAEFGIRIALGAQPADVIGIVFASTLASVSGGILAGLALTLASSTLLSQWVKGNSHDPRILISGAAVLAIVAAIACAIPAWRACRADPMAALRCE